MDLFEHVRGQDSSQAPLAERLRPKTLNDFLGQTRITSRNAPWLSGSLSNLILWGPPGCGKTSLAGLIAEKAQAEVVNRNAIDLGAKELKELGESAKRRLFEFNKKTLLFIDEIHRLNKAQQDVLLPFLERGHLVLIGATTENPSYELNAALLSRCTLLVFEALSLEELGKLLEKACISIGVTVADILREEARERLLDLADGDARRLLNMLEIIFATETKKLSVEALGKVLSAISIRYDKNSDQHYDVISAFIKSIRGSDPDAGLYYLARMLKGGEDPVFIARRLVILASEDIGNADPRGLSLAVSGLQAVELVGMPEAAISLAQVVTYLASAPKSNRSYMGLNKAQALVEETGTQPVPLALRSSKTSAMKDLGYGRDYKYSHEGSRGYLEQEFLPENLRERVRKDRLYDPSEHGFEKNIRQYLEWLRGKPL